MIFNAKSHDSNSAEEKVGVYSLRRYCDYNLKDAINVSV